MQKYRFHDLVSGHSEGNDYPEPESNPNENHDWPPASGNCTPNAEGSVKTMAPRKVVPNARHRKAARELVRKGKAPAEALRCAGFPPKQARKGIGEFTKRAGLRKAVNDEYRRFLNESRDLPDKTEQERIVLHRLVQNLVRGEDKGVQSAKLLGTHKDLRLWESENVIGIFMQKPPKGFEQYLSLEENFEKGKLSADD